MKQVTQRLNVWGLMIAILFVNTLGLYEFSKVTYHWLGTAPLTYWQCMYLLLAFRMVVLLPFKDRYRLHDDWVKLKSTPKAERLSKEEGALLLKLCISVVAVLVYYLVKSIAIA